LCITLSHLWMTQMLVSSPGLPLLATHGTMRPEPKLLSKAAKSRWADMCDSDSDDDLIEFSRALVREETIDMCQPNGSCAQMVIGIGTEKEATTVDECLLPLQSDFSNAQIGPSVGSLQHHQGTCRPCVFARTSSGCHNGVHCRFCHFMHKRKAQVRPCKERRRRFHQRLEDVMRWMEEEAEWLFNDPDWLALVFAKLPQFLSCESEVKRKVERKLVAHALDVRRQPE